MIDLYLKFTDEAAANAVLYTQEPTEWDNTDPENPVATAWEPHPNYANIDTIGIIYKPTGEMVQSEDGPYPEMAPIPGWHVNVGGVANCELTELLAYAVHPKSPVRAWAPPPAGTIKDVGELKKMAMACIDAHHEFALLKLTGNPTQAEQTTWAGKVVLAEAIVGSHTLTSAQVAFLHTAGIDEDGRMDYAHAVQARSAKYWALVGLADKVRSDCRGRIAAATSHESLEQAQAENIAQQESALAAVFG